MPGRSLQKNSVKDQKKIPPFRVWIVTGILFLAVIVGTHFLPDIPKTANDLPTYFNHSRLEGLSAGAAGSGFPSVVVIGTSLTQCAFFFDEEMEKFAVQNGFGGLRFTEVSRGLARLDDFIPLLGIIKEAKPEFLFLESNLFGIEFSQKNDARDKLRFYIKKVLGIKGKEVKRQPDRNNLPEGALKQNKKRQHQRSTDFIMYRDVIIKNAGLRPFSLPREYEIVVEDLRRRGTKIILLDMPRSTKAVSAYNPGFLDEMRLMIRRYQVAYGLLHWESPYYPDLDYYSDFAHLNEKGRIAYSRWFLKELSRIRTGDSQ
jgi:hypothetical protein